MTIVKLITVGSSVGIPLPDESLKRLGVKVGDMLQVIESPKGIELTPCDPEFIEQIDLAEEAMRTDSNVLKRLAE
jgi:putative addiction module antidote